MAGATQTAFHRATAGDRSRTLLKTPRFERRTLAVAEKVVTLMACEAQSCQRRRGAGRVSSRDRERTTRLSEAGFSPSRQDTDSYRWHSTCNPDRQEGSYGRLHPAIPCLSALRHWTGRADCRCRTAATGEGDLSLRGVSGDVGVVRPRDTAVSRGWRRPFRTVQPLVPSRRARLQRTVVSSLLMTRTAGRGRGDPLEERLDGVSGGG